MTLYGKAKRFEAGEKITFGGREYPALYTPKNDTLINQFGITDGEQRQLRTLISRDMAAERRRERDRKRDEARRRASGAVDRETYLEGAQERRRAAQALRAEGLSVPAIAARLGVSKSLAALYAAGEGVQSPSPITGGEASAPREAF
ncbi:hypothetical protein Xazr_11905 [Xanthomonas campestris pv. azadirachtae]|nr:hypothetical protein Xazr_11905 [Xanthomonas campestris pv. azadirachtae]